MKMVLVLKYFLDIEQYVEFKMSVLIFPSKSLISSRWDNMLKLNPSKCQALQVYFGKNPLQPGDLRIGSEPPSYINEAKVLDLYLETASNGTHKLIIC